MWARSAVTEVHVLTKECTFGEVPREGSQRELEHPTVGYPQVPREDPTGLEPPQGVIYPVSCDGGAWRMLMWCHVSGFSDLCTRGGLG